MRHELEQAKDLAEAINLSDGENDACDDGGDNEEGEEDDEEDDDEEDDENPGRGRDRDD